MTTSPVGAITRVMLFVQDVSKVAAWIFQDMRKHRRTAAMQILSFGTA